MKRISVIGLFFILCALTSQAQTEIPIRTINRQSLVKTSESDRTIKNIYSTQNLGKASLEELNQYLRKARNKRNEGFGLVIAGPALIVGGALLVDASNRNKRNSRDENDEQFKSGITLLGMGLLASVMSLPTIVTGTVRVSKVKKAMNDRIGAGLNLSPCLVYIDKTQNPSPGLVLKVRF